MNNRNVFSKEGEFFLKDKMCICLEDLNAKILRDALEEKDFFKCLIDFFLKLEFPYDYNNKLEYCEGSDNRDFLEEQLAIFLSTKNLEEDTNAMIIYNELHHALKSYVGEGLEGLYIHRAAECWYPKVIIKSIIGDKSFINELDDIITIYRGTSQDEFESRIYGQSWSLEMTQAENFAFIHYKGYEKYLNTIRVVIEAKINKKDIYYYRKFHAEKEIVINPLKLLSDSIKIIESRKLI
jgi:hypothetical protein